MHDAKIKMGKDGYITKDMGLFYRSLGAFNTNMVAAIIKDPGLLQEAIDYLVAYCPVHAAQCGSGNTWDEIAHLCYRTPEGGPGLEEGPDS